ncbi:MAG: adenylate kinase [Paraglaciecola sp.]|uniref:adenylate kinase n=2 Tax=Paraglaciecola sp. TaxID=1920173 RepID=UPI003297882E
MKKVNVIGTSGSGKSHFSKRLAEALDSTYIEMDAMLWQPDWQPLDTSEFVMTIQEIISNPSFVLDGNHSKTNSVKWSVVDTIIWLDLGFWRTFTQILRRSIKRSYARSEIWAGTGNKESFYRSFFSSESVIWWMLKNYWKTKSKYRNLFKEKSSSNMRLIRLRSRAEVEAFLVKIRRS